MKPLQDLRPPETEKPLETLEVTSWVSSPWFNAHLEVSNEKRVMGQISNKDPKKVYTRSVDLTCVKKG